MTDWVLVEGRLSPEEGRAFVATMLEGDSPQAGILPILPSGSVHEIVSCGEGTSFDPRLSVRSLGWLERTWRMIYRVFGVWSRLAPSQRRYCNLTLPRAILDLAGSYRTAMQFRGEPYRWWIENADVLTDRNRQTIRAQLAGWQDCPQFCAILVAGGSGEREAQTLASLGRQLYQNHFLWQAARPVGYDWLLLLRRGDQLAEYALYWFACEARAHPDAVMIYADDDEIDTEGRRSRPRFKPDWSMLHLRETDYIGRVVAINGRALAAAGGLKPENLAGDTWELLLRIGELAGDRVRHIPAVLLHRDAEAERSVAPVFRRARFHLPAVPPLVSIVIPTRDAVGLLRQCVESLLEKTTYPYFEIVVVDNGSRDAAALDYLAEIATRPRVSVLRYDRPFNYSAINNFAVAQVQGEVLCLLNNDTEVISPDWLDEMVSHLVQEKVGVVGAKLFYPDGRVQHGGDTVGPGGCANHLHQFIARDDPGYCNRAIVAQELSAVTAACLVTWRFLYVRLGGLNEKHLPVAFNDVDYCLRIRKAGYKVVWTPHAELYHHESVSRGKDKGWRRKFRAWREVRYMRRTWQEEMKSDPFYNPNFSYLRPDFVLGPAPNVNKPWVNGMQKEYEPA